MQPGKSGEYTERPVSVGSITIKYFFIPRSQNDRIAQAADAMFIRHLAQSA